MSDIAYPLGGCAEAGSLAWEEGSEVREVAQNREAPDPGHFAPCPVRPRKCL